MRPCPAADLLSACALALVAGAFACGTPVVEPPPTPDAGAGCTSSSACAGFLCLGGQCAACPTDDHCTQDPAYGAGARCELATGHCLGCAEGSSGCACRGGACDADLRCSPEGRCIACPAGSRDCGCRDGACDDGLACLEGACVEPTCSAGSLDCPCLSGSCDGEATCVAGTCRACAADRAGCACRSGACTQGLVCDTTNLTCRAARACVDLGCDPHRTCTPPNGGADATCEEACEQGWDWNPDTSACDPIAGASCEPGGALTDACAVRGRSCVEAGTAASCGDCAPGHLPRDDRAGWCRPAITCPQIRARCETSSRTCEAPAGRDATCGACLPGRVEAGDRCVIDAAATCDAGQPKSIVTACASLGRTCLPGTTIGAGCGPCLTGFADDPAQSTACVDGTACANPTCTSRDRVCAPGAPDASCGGCARGYVPLDPADPTSACVRASRCSDLTCPEGKACVEAAGVGTCVDWPCADATHAKRLDNGACVPCGNVCGDGHGGPANGETGRLFPYTRDARNVCMCETQPGFYLDVTAALAARPCDEDGDGWLRGGVRDVVASGDTQLVANARCTPHSVDRVTLRNEWGQERDVLLCRTGRTAADGGSCEAAGLGSSAPLVLYESERNDDPDLVSAATEVDFPAWSNALGSPTPRGRRLRADEVMPLTKACVSETADFNGNGAADLTEWHGMPPPVRTPALSEDERVWLDFTYFVELARSWYQPPAAGRTHGSLVIAERSRCAAPGGTQVPFPIGYTEANAYWRSCTRRRDASFDLSRASEPFGLTTLDFARWDCNEAAGSCPVLPAVTSGTTLPGAVPRHGLCDATAIPADGHWRGFGHESQFKCAQVVASEQARLGAHHVLRSELQTTSGTGRRTWNVCAIDCAANDPTCANECAPGAPCSSEPVASGSQPRSPRVTCVPVTANAASPADRAVGFTAVRFTPGATYQGGCVDEQYEFPSLCPGWKPPPPAGEPPTASGSLVGSDESAFGQLACGCSVDHGGAQCEIGCPPGQVARTTPYQTIGRTGMFWMCAATSASAGLTTPAQGGPWSLRSAEIPVDTHARVPLCSAPTTATTGPAGAAPCASGWRLQ